MKRHLVVIGAEVLVILAGGEASHGLELLDLMNKLAPHMIILDTPMPKLKGIEATRRIKIVYPDVKVLILTMHKSQEYLDHALSTGADAYPLKEDANTELFSAIERIRQGGAYVSPLLSRRLTDGPR
jgi:DNA-binding NarL/FixJ family response regulator